MTALGGRRVVVTRAAEQASDLADRLAAAGAVPIIFSTIQIEEPADGGEALARAAGNLADYGWIVLTSQNGAARLLAHLAGAFDLGAVRVAAIGPATAAALQESGITVDLVPRRHIAEGLLAEFPLPEPGRTRVLLPQAAQARDVLALGLRAIGYEVDVVEAYRTTASQPARPDLAAVATADAVTFTSSSTVAGFVAAAGLDCVPGVVACIGPVTAATAVELGLQVDVVAAEHTTAGLVAALVDVAERGWPVR